MKFQPQLAVEFSLLSLTRLGSNAYKFRIDSGRYEEFSTFATPVENKPSRKSEFPIKQVCRKFLQIPWRQFVEYNGDVNWLTGIVV